MKAPSFTDAGLAGRVAVVTGGSRGIGRAIVETLVGAGMTVSVGRLRRCPVLGWKFVVLGHNTIRGAAGAAVLNAELMVAEGFVS